MKKKQLALRFPCMETQPCHTLPELSGCGNSGTSRHNHLSPSYVPLKPAMCGHRRCSWVASRVTRIRVIAVADNGGNISLCTDCRKNTLRVAFSVQTLSFKMNLSFTSCGFSMGRVLPAQALSDCPRAKCQVSL